jgi:hypothetical protein
LSVQETITTDYTVYLPEKEDKWMNSTYQCGAGWGTKIENICSKFKRFKKTLTLDGYPVKN